jgi:hypothetical protein
MWRYLLAAPRRHPFIFGTTLAGVKAGGVDFAVQTQYEGRSVFGDEPRWDQVDAPANAAPLFSVLR